MHEAAKVLDVGIAPRLVDTIGFRSQAEDVWLNNIISVNLHQSGC